MAIYDFSQPVTQDLVLVPHYGPIPPSLPNLKLLLGKMAMEDVRKIIPVGSELPDVDPENQSLQNPWIVANYETITAADGKVYEAAAILRKYLTHNAVNVGADDWYGNSPERTTLEGTYWNNCSAEAKAAISPVRLKFLQNVASNSCPIFVPSARNLCLATQTQHTTYQDMGNYWELYGGVANNDAITERRCARAAAPTSYIAYFSRDNAPTTGPYNWYYAGVGTTGAYADFNDDSTASAYLRAAAYVLGTPPGTFSGGSGGAGGAFSVVG